MPQSPYEMLWWDLKRECPQTSMNFKEDYNEEFAKILSEWCERLNKLYRKQLLQLIVAKYGFTIY